MEHLVDQVIHQIITDVSANDLTALEGLLHFLSEPILRGYLEESLKEVTQ